MHTLCLFCTQTQPWLDVKLTDSLKDADLQNPAKVQISPNYLTRGSADSENLDAKVVNETDRDHKVNSTDSGVVSLTQAKSMLAEQDYKVGPDSSPKKVLADSDVSVFERDDDVAVSELESQLAPSVLQARLTRALQPQLPEREPLPEPLVEPPHAPELELEPLPEALHRLQAQLRADRHRLEARNRLEALDLEFDPLIASVASHEL